VTLPFAGGKVQGRDLEKNGKGFENAKAGLWWGTLSGDEKGEGQKMVLKATEKQSMPIG